MSSPYAPHLLAQRICLMAAYVSRNESVFLIYHCWEPSSLSACPLSPPTCPWTRLLLSSLIRLDQRWVSTITSSEPQDISAVRPMLRMNTGCRLNLLMLSCHIISISLTTVSYTTWCIQDQTKPISWTKSILILVKTSFNSTRANPKSSLTG